MIHQALEDLTKQYIMEAEALAGWANGKLELFSKEADASSSEEVCGSSGAPQRKSCCR